MNVSVLGCGRWGSFVAWYLDEIGMNVTLWGRESSSNLKRLVDERKNDVLSLKETVTLTSDLEKAVSKSQIILISISAQSLRSFIRELSKLDLQDKTIVLCMKSLEESSGKRLTQIVREYVGETTNLAVWVGPGHAESLVKGVPNCMVIDSRDFQTKKFLVDKFTSKLIRFYYGTDLIGNEIGAAAKNVIGIAAGALDGLGLAPLKGALMSRGAAEISRLIKAVGGNENSAYGLCHLGDYQATLFSEHSNNRKFGESLVKKEKYSKLAEGVSTSKALTLLGLKYKVDLPISRSVNDLIEGRLNIETAISDLFLRTIKHEF